MNPLRLIEDAIAVATRHGPVRAIRLYMALGELERDGLIERREGGYRITAHGEQVLKEKQWAR